MKAFLIDPVNRRIHRVMCDGSYGNIKDLLHCAAILPMTIKENSCLYFSFEKETGYTFNLRRRIWSGIIEEVIDGPSLLIDCDDEGEHVDCSLSMADVEAMVIFP